MSDAERMQHGRIPLGRFHYDSSSFRALSVPLIGRSHLSCLLDHREIDPSDIAAEPCPKVWHRYHSGGCSDTNILKGKLAQ